MHTLERTSRLKGSGFSGAVGLDEGAWISSDKAVLAGRGCFRRVALLGLLWAGFGCLPHPESVKEHRENFDRNALKGVYLLDAPPADMHPVHAEFGGSAQLMGYTLTPDSKHSPGDRVDIKLYWTALAPMAEDYEIFVHGDGEGVSTRLHGDHFPAAGKYPTDVWRDKDVIVDPFSMSIPSGYMPSQLQVFVGLYLGNYRVPLTNKGLAPGDNENRSQAITIKMN